jgi:transcriptional regulator with XRE-family HTH domain
VSNKTKHSPNRALWQARKRSGLGQKNVAFLLGHETHTKISLYENGQSIPTLQTALRLEAIYKVPVRILFYNLFRNGTWEVVERSLKRKQLLANEKANPSASENQLLEGDYCTYAELLKAPNLPEVERRKAEAHLRYLAKTINSANGIDY